MSSRNVVGLILCVSALAGCGTVIEPGHRGLLFDPRHGGLSPDVLGPGWHRVGVWGRVDDFDVTFSTKTEELHTISVEGLAIDVKVSIIFRPIVNQLYDLDTEIGPNYYDEVVGPEFRTATRGVFARHSYLDMQKQNEKIEDEVEDEVRRRIHNRHIEISSVTLEGLNLGADITNAIRQKLVGAEEAVRKKTALEAESLRRHLEMEHDAERAVMQAAADLRKKENEHAVAEEQAKLDKLNAETAAAVRVTRARAEAKEAELMAVAHAAEKKSEATTLTPLMVMMHAYDALAKLGGEGTHIMLGDWSKVPNFLIPSNMSSLAATMHR